LENTHVKSYDGKLVTTSTELSFEAATLVWAAGVKGAAIKGLDTQELLTKSNLMRVNKFNQIIGYENIFAFGDVAEMESEEYPCGHYDGETSFTTRPQFRP
jgi:NADH dehydrogenase